MQKQKSMYIALGVGVLVVVALVFGNSNLFQGALKKKPAAEEPRVTRAQCQALAAEIALATARSTRFPENFDWSSYYACWQAYPSFTSGAYATMDARLLAQTRRCGELRRLEESLQLPPGRNAEVQLCRTSNPEVWQAPSYATCQGINRLLAQGVHSKQIPGYSWQAVAGCYRVYGL